VLWLLGYIPTLRALLEDVIPEHAIAQHFTFLLGARNQQQKVSQESRV
jgi:hypothetical protein